MDDINKLRAEVDKIDDELVALYLKRMRTVGEIGALKAKSDKPILDLSRERAVKYRLAENAPDDMKLYIKELYDVVFSTSRAYQSRMSDAVSPTVEQILSAVEGGLSDFPVTATVACQGVEGANSECAAARLFSIPSITYFKNFEAVFAAVDKGFCEFGVLPIENSTAGSVSEVYDLMRKYNFYVVRTVKVGIDHCLCAVKGADKKTVKTVASHRQALMQCSEYLKKTGIAVEEAPNTATAARELSESGDKTRAVLCSSHCADVYGLTVLERSVQDNDKNYTRFICIAKDIRVYKGSDKISVTVSLDHTPGSLNRTLSKFNSLGLNLTKLESRPIVGSDFEFLFYFDFEGDVTDKSVLGLLADLQNGSDNFTFLGAYKEVV